MNAMDCLVHPQIGTEALGLVICEAHACGKPVIASALDGIPEAFAAGNYGELVTPEDIEALAGAMERQAGKGCLEMEGRKALHAAVRRKYFRWREWRPGIWVYLRELCALPAAAVERRRANALLTAQFVSLHVWCTW